METGLIPGLGRSPGEGNGYPCQYSDLENSMDKGTWQAPVHGVAKRQTQQRLSLKTKSSWASLVIRQCRVCLQCRRPGFNPWIWEILWRRQWQLQYSCLENSMDRGTWWAPVHGVARVRQDWVTSTFTFKCSHVLNLSGNSAFLLFLHRFLNPGEPLCRPLADCEEELKWTGCVDMHIWPMVQRACASIPLFPYKLCSTVDKSHLIHLRALG